MGKVLGTVARVGLAVAGTALSGGTLGAVLIAGGLAAASAVADLVLAPKAPRASPAQEGRLGFSLVPDTPRKLVFGRTAMPADVRYEEYSGAQQEYLDRIVVVASHRVDAIEELWLEQERVWTAAGGVAGKWRGFLSVTPVLEGGPGRGVTINAGTGWHRDTHRLTGCAYLHLRYRLHDGGKVNDSPFAAGVPGRVTIIGRGMPLPDVRLGHNPSDQASWTFGAGGNNAALQVLAFLIGWRIGGKLAVGCGYPASRLDVGSFVTAANMCDETVARAAGGTEPRYRSAGVFSEADARRAALEVLLAGCGGELRDSGGRLSLHIAHNDLAAPVIDLADDDIVSGWEWDPTPSLEATYNVVRGSRIDASAQGLYQPVDYPAVRIASPDGIERFRELELPTVESASQAQRLAKQDLQRAGYQGLFRASVNARGWAATVGSVVRLSFSPFGWTRKLFRVVGQTIDAANPITVPLVLREEHAEIYLWDREEAPAVTAADATIYDPANAPLVIAWQLAEAALSAAQAAAGTISAIGSDSIYARVEKSELIARMGEIEAVYVQLYEQLTGQGLTAARDAMAAARVNYLVARNALSPPWNDTSTDTVLGGNNPTKDQLRALLDAYVAAMAAAERASRAKAAETALWAGVQGAGKPDSYVVRAAGFNAFSDGLANAGIGLFRADGTRVAGFDGTPADAKHMWTVCLLDSLGRWQVTGGYDTLGSEAGAQALVARLNDIRVNARGMPLVVYTFDEPATVHGPAAASATAAALRDALVEHGANEVTLRRMTFRSAYLLVTNAGAGPAGGLEAWRGDPSAVAERGFAIVNGRVQLGGNPNALNTLRVADELAEVVRQQAADAVDDGVLTPPEKAIMLERWEQIHYLYHTGNARSAAQDALSPNSYDARVAADTAYDALVAMLNAVSPPWYDTTSTSPIAGINWTLRWTAASRTIALLWGRIQEVERAAGAATRADVDAALADIGAIVADNVLDRSEKPRQYQLWLTYNESWYYTRGRGVELGLSTAAVDAARQALVDYLNAVAFTNYAVDSAVDGALLRELWRVAYGQLDVLRQGISREDARRSEWGSVSGPGKPEDDATKNPTLGEWNAATAYPKGALVTWQGGGYIATRAVPAGVEPSNTTYWQRTGGAPGAAAMTIAVSPLAAPSSTSWTVLGQGTLLVKGTVTARFLQSYSVASGAQRGIYVIEGVRPSGAVVTIMAEVTGDYAQASEPGLATGTGSYATGLSADEPWTIRILGRQELGTPALSPRPGSYLRAEAG